MARAAVSASLIKLFSLKLSSQPLSSIPATTISFSTFHAPPKKKKQEKRRESENKKTTSSSSSPSIVVASGSASSDSKSKSSALKFVKRRTRSDKEFDEDYIKKYGDEESHVPVMLGEVLDVFDSSSSSFQLRSFVDCTLGAAGHSCAVSFLAHFEISLNCNVGVI